MLVNHKAVYQVITAAAQLDKECDQVLSNPTVAEIPSIELAESVSTGWASLMALDWAEALDRKSALHGLFDVGVLDDRSTRQWCIQENIVPAECQRSAQIDSTAFAVSFHNRLREIIFVVLCKNYLARAWKSKQRSSELSTACCASCGVTPPLLGAGVSPECSIVQLTDRELTMALRALDSGHAELRLTVQHKDYLEALLLRTAVELVIRSQSQSGKFTVAPVDIDENKTTVALAERVWAGVIVDASACTAFARGCLISAEALAVHERQQGESQNIADLNPFERDMRGESEEWINVSHNLRADVQQAASQAPAQRPLITVRQQVCIASMLTYGWSTGVMRGLTSLERQGRDTTAQLFQTMTYRKPGNMWTATSPLEQSVALSVLRGALVFQHGEEAGAWLDAVSPWRTIDGGCVLNTFGLRQRRTALAYVTDACHTALYAERGDAAAPPASMVAALMRHVA